MMSMGNRHPLVMASGKQIKGGHTFVFGENDTRAVHDACPKALQLLLYGDVNAGTSRREMQRHISVAC